MKNSKYLSYERNKYFYGKLLSVNDFELEQRYMNDKRRLLNRFIVGTGIVAGLYVVGVDEQTVSIEMGFALDSLGREIVVDSPLIKKLSLIEGFDSCIQSQNVTYAYLCLDYHENETEMVHNITKSVSGESDQGDSNYSKIKESYQLYLTTREPEREDLSTAELYEDTKTVYWEDGIRISQIMPKYVIAGQKIPLKIKVENQERENISFSYDLILTCLMYEGEAKVKVVFDEALVERTGTYELVYYLDANDRVDVEGLAVVDEESGKLRLSGKSKEAVIQGKSVVYIGLREQKEEVIHSYYKTAMENIMKNGYQQPIYLAKIFMVKAGDIYIIDKIENAPFRQYVMNNMLLDALDQLIRKEGSTDSSHVSFGGMAESLITKKDNIGGIQITQGVTVVPMGFGGKKGEKFFSGDIIHGLGLGKVNIILGMEKDMDNITYGSSEIFEVNGVNAELAANLNPNKGSFVIGIRLIAATNRDEARIHWTAVRDMRDVISQKNDRKIFIKPNVLELRIRETQYLETICENMLEKNVQWTVKDNGGSVDANGMYTAPNTAGVYEVIAQSIAYPTIKASVFIVVRQA